MKPPETHFARSGDLHIAYQVIGDGPVDVVSVAGWIFPLEIMWESPRFVRYLEGLSRGCRLVSFDKRGTGMSDRIPHIPTLEERMDDVRAVMDAAGMRRAAIVGHYDGGAMAALFAATYPGRVASLVLWATWARTLRGEGYPWGLSQEALDAFADLIERSWGKAAFLPIAAPSLEGDQAFREWFARSERVGASPGGAAALARTNAQIDIRSVLPAIRVPTLVITRSDLVIPSNEEVRWVASQIPGATYVELPGRDVLPIAGDMEAVIEEISAFVTGARPAPVPERILATVLFTDIVGSTERARELGDERWRELLDRHDATVRREVDRFRGRVVKQTGDGVLATFDGPARAIRSAQAIRDGLSELGLRVRIGLHTGEVEARGEDVSGVAVHLASRVVDHAGPGEVLVSRTVTDLVAGSGITFEDRGARDLKGVPGHWALFAVTG